MDVKCVFCFPLWLLFENGAHLYWCRFLWKAVIKLVWSKWKLKCLHVLCNSPVPHLMKIYSLFVVSCVWIVGQSDFNRYFIVIWTCLQINNLNLFICEGHNLVLFSLLSSSSESLHVKPHYWYWVVKFSVIFGMIRFVDENAIS